MTTGVTSGVTSAAEAISAARRYAESIAAGVIERDQSGKVPTEALEGLDESGLLGITIALGDGGPGLGPSVLAEVIATIAAVDPAIAQTPQGHFLLIDILTVLGDAALRRRLFHGVRKGQRLAAAFAERGGRHAQDLRTRVTRDGRGLTLTGQKYYCTGALTARWIGVSALDDDDQLVVAFVENGARGLTLDQDWNVMGQRATVSGSARLDGVPVDPTSVVPYHLAFERPQQLGARAQLVHAAIQVGIARGALRDAGEFVRTRARPFFEAVRTGWADSAASDPYTIGRFGRLTTRVNAAEQLLLWAARTLEAVELAPATAHDAAIGSLAVAQAKAFASETAVEVASDLFSLAGASAADERHDLSRHWRNARTHASHDPVDWKYHHVGNFALKGTLPPSHGQL